MFYVVYKQTFKVSTYTMQKAMVATYALKTTEFIFTSYHGLTNSSRVIAVLLVQIRLI